MWRKIREVSKRQECGKREECVVSDRGVLWLPKCTSIYLSSIHTCACMYVRELIDAFVYRSLQAVYLLFRFPLQIRWPNDQGTTDRWLYKDNTRQVCIYYVCP